MPPAASALRRACTRRTSTKAPWKQKGSGTTFHHRSIIVCVLLITVEGRRCGNGTYATMEGAISPFECNYCPPGSFQTGVGALECSTCAPGTYSTGVGFAAEHDCVPCGPGTFATGSVMVSQDEFSLCGGGSYLTRLGHTSPADCAPCGQAPTKAVLEV